MTDGALIAIGAFTGTAPARRGHQIRGPGHFVGIYVQYVVHRIDGRTAPFGAPVEAREDDGVLLERKGEKLPVAAHVLELVDGPLVDCRIARGEVISGEALAGEGL